MNKHEIRWKGIAVKRETRSREMSRKRRRTRKEGSVDGYVVTGWLDSRLKWTRRRATRSYPIAAAATESSALNRASLHSLYYTYRYQPSTYGHARALACSVSEAGETKGDGARARETQGTGQRRSYSLYKCVIREKPWCALNYQPRHCHTTFPRLVDPATLQLTSRPLSTWP